MSSIAYATDEKMIEYHRLCGNRTINFWRLSSKKDFTDFHKGDLLFFYAKSQHSKEKGFVGYAHYVTVNRLSLRQMWKRYGTLNGYDTEEHLKEAISRAAKNRPIPDRMNCLYLDDVVFFMTPVYPSSVHSKINRTLESYAYLDQENPQMTMRILKQAEINGIDIWSASQTAEPVNIFKKDELRHQMALIAHEVGKYGSSESETVRAKRLIRKMCAEGYELIHGSHIECMKITADSMELKMPFVYSLRDKDARLNEIAGRIMHYKYEIAKSGLNLRKVRFEIVSEQPEQEAASLVEKLNEE